MTTEHKGMKHFVQRAPVVTNSQKGVVEYFLSKQEDHNIKKYPEWDKPRVYPALEVVRARSDLTKVEEKLREKWVEQEKRRKLMDEQWAEMRLQESILRESFIKFNRFVRENQEKRERAEAKIKEERERQAKRLEEIEELTAKLVYMKEVRDKMKTHVEEYRKYQTYLDKVINDTSEFQSIAEIFNRYETLMEARTILSEHQDKNLQILEERGAELYHMTESKTQKFMGLNNKLAQLQARRDRAEVRARKWETIVSKIKVTAAEKNLEHTQVKTCCWNLYQQICKRKGVPVTADKDDVEQQLNDIKRTILELKRLLKIAKKDAPKEAQKT
ncbi:coiled-coil domain-containing protein 42 like-2 [Megachile rotundata]|uniref:coiled-coil domain-containing protein 42 like-2 n=1 Tax=Megachile rotundata TaxID=143995 RepID=UPI000258E318|nr:PREDICTED: coiled-coil domain-containing protein 42 like-2 isoform X2 [Megachile rotundata]XP_012138285.1 PREDICTED: coiled-coil domain-containing protein 42 like-2 isoform X2 [Megachile rotundata]XP_012138286.1 PREDICTED: coiled-coil domain-containing protein 42 like-2 isoform X2 [Megachile rotundata]